MAIQGIKMYIPSKFLNTLITSEQIGVWVESNSKGSKAFIIKVPSSVAKSIELGAKIELIIAVSELDDDSNFLILALKIYDRKDNPFLGVLPQTTDCRNNVINSDFFDKPISFSIYDELDAPVFTGQVEISTNDKNRDFTYKLDSLTFCTPSGTKESYELIDIFGFYANLPQFRDMNPPLYMDLFTYDLTISDIKGMLTFHVHPNSTGNYTLGKDIDGTVQETQLSQSLNLFFNQQAYHSPLVTIGKTTRELTDALALAENYILTIESKCLTVDLNTLNQTTERNISNTVSHANKAIKQLIGGFKAIKRNEEIKTQSGQKIDFDRSGPHHGIVIIPEFISSKKWEPVVKKMINTYEQIGLKLHVISLPEFTAILKMSELDKNNLFSVFETRHDILMKLRRVDIESINSELPTIQDLINEGLFNLNPVPSPKG